MAPGTICIVFCSELIIIIIIILEATMSKHFDFSNFLIWWLKPVFFLFIYFVIYLFIYVTIKSTNLIKINPLIWIWVKLSPFKSFIIVAAPCNTGHTRNQKDGKRTWELQIFSYSCWRQLFLKALVYIFFVLLLFFLVHLSWKLKWDFLIDSRPSVCKSVNF